MLIISGIYFVPHKLKPRTLHTIPPKKPKNSVHNNSTNFTKQTVALHAAAAAENSKQDICLNENVRGNYSKSLVLSQIFSDIS